MATLIAHGDTREPHHGEGSWAVAQAISVAYRSVYGQTRTTVADGDIVAVATVDAWQVWRNA